MGGGGGRVRHGPPWGHSISVHAQCTRDSPLMHGSRPIVPPVLNGALGDNSMIDRSGAACSRDCMWAAR